jgi:predicted hydrocarbon binding protein
MVCDNPYPCAFDQGIFAGMARRFGCYVNITHLDEVMCRHTGSNQCSYRVEW